MQTDFNDIQKLWKQEQNDNIKASNAAYIIKMAERKRKKNTRTQWGNIFVLLVFTIILSSYFLFVAHFQFNTSKAGEFLMIGSLLLRIMIEVGSLVFSGRIDISEDALKSNNSFLTYFNFRKKIHGPVTVAIVILYSIGFYLLSPEFSNWFPLWLLVLIDVSYLAAAFIFGYFIRSAIGRELKTLNEIRRFREDLLSQ